MNSLTPHDRASLTDSCLFPVCCCCEVEVYEAYIFVVVLCCHVNIALLTDTHMGVLFAKLWSLFSTEGALYSSLFFTSMSFSGLANGCVQTNPDIYIT